MNIKDLMRLDEFETVAGTIGLGDYLEGGNIVS
jgi:hypothetical protein